MLRVFTEPKNEVGKHRKRMLCRDLRSEMSWVSFDRVVQVGRIVPNTLGVTRTASSHLRDGLQRYTYYYITISSILLHPPPETDEAASLYPLPNLRPAYHLVSGSIGHDRLYRSVCR